MRILFAIISSIAGLLLLFGGYRLARFIIPLMGFVAGLSLGGAIISDMAGTVFLGTVLGVFIGLIAGLVLAALAYFYYSLAILVLAGGLGYWAGSGFIALLGIDPGLLSAVVGIGLGIVVGLVALFTNAPKWVLIVLTSVGGAVTTVGGVLLLFNKIPLETYSYTTANTAISDSFFWTVVTLGLLVIGLSVQAATTDEYEFSEWTMGNETHNLPPTTTTHLPGVH